MLFTYYGYQVFGKSSGVTPDFYSFDWAGHTPFSKEIKYCMNLDTLQKLQKRH